MTLNSHESSAHVVECATGDETGVDARAKGGIPRGRRRGEGDAHKMFRATTAKRDADDEADDDALVIFQRPMAFRGHGATSLSVGGSASDDGSVSAYLMPRFAPPARGRYVGVCFRSLRLADGCLEAPSVVYTL